MTKPTYDDLLAFVQQMARMTTLQQEYDADPELQAVYDDADEYHSDLDDDRLMDELGAFQSMIEAAQALVRE